MERARGGGSARVSLRVLFNGKQRVITLNFRVNAEWDYGKLRKLPASDFQLSHVVTRSDFEKN